MGIFDLLGSPKKKDRDYKPTKPLRRAAPRHEVPTKRPAVSSEPKKADAIPTSHTIDQTRRLKILSTFILNLAESGVEIPSSILSILDKN